MPAAGDVPVPSANMGENGKGKEKKSGEMRSMNAGCGLWTGGRLWTDVCGRVDG